MLPRTPMGIIIDREIAVERFGRALTLAHADTPLPDEWIERTQKISAARSKTFTAVLGTALLARVADEDVDPVSLREDESDRGYSARSLAKDVLVPCCVRADIGLRVTGAEPLNNQPFLRASRVTRSLKVPPKSISQLVYLCESVEAIVPLRGKTALEALAAFLRVRMLSRPARVTKLGARPLGLSELLKAAEQQSTADGSGSVSVALVAAGFSLLFSEVRAKRSNDPTSTWPGDVGVFDRGTQRLAIHVQHRGLSESDTLIFAARVEEANIQRAVAISIGGDEESTDVEQLQFQAQRQHGVELFVFFSVAHILRTLAMLAPMDLRAWISKYSEIVLERMTEVGASSEDQQAWVDYFAGVESEELGIEP